MVFCFQSQQGIVMSKSTAELKKALKSLQARKIDPEDSVEMVMGFEFNKEDAVKLRSCDTTMRILADLQEHGVAIVSESFYTTQHGELLRSMEDEYWRSFSNKDYIALIVHEFEPVFEG
jgi:arsenate reductase-like glutaredoxin family protein